MGLKSFWGRGWNDGENNVRSGRVEMVEKDRCDIGKIGVKGGRR